MSRLRPAIYLMAVTGSLLAAEGSNEVTLAEDANQDFVAWIHRVRDAGIEEYDTPDYYGLILRALAAGRAHADRGGRIEDITRYVWTDLAANWFPGRDSLSGPHARSYDWTYERGTVDWQLYLAGFTNRVPTGIGAGHLMGVLLDAELRGGFRPGPPVREIFRTETKVVRQWWGPSHGADGRDRYNYVTPTFAIGSASSDYQADSDKVHLMDMPLVAELGPPETPVIYAIADRHDNPYGDRLDTKPDGESIVGHVRSRPVTVQSHGTVFATFVPDPRSSGSSLTTNIVFPFRIDEVLLNGTPVAPLSTARTIAITKSSVIALRSDQGAVAFRVLRADPCLGDTVELRLKSEPSGIERGVARLAIYHVKRSRAIDLTQCQPKVALLMSAGRFDDVVRARVNNARYQDAIEGGVWRASVSYDDTTLASGRDLGAPGHSIRYRRINGQDLRTDRLSVNGEVLGPTAFTTP